MRNQTLVFKIKNLTYIEYQWEKYNVTQFLFIPELSLPIYQLSIMLDYFEILWSVVALIFLSLFVHLPSIFGKNLHLLETDILLYESLAPRKIPIVIISKEALRFTFINIIIFILCLILLLLNKSTIGKRENHLFWL